jgi:hypothetical protein
VKSPQVKQSGELEEREREREREREWINGVRDRVSDRNGNGVGQKWPSVKMNT